MKPVPLLTLLNAALAVACALALVGLAAAYLALMIGWLARRKPGYRHLVHTISELGEVSAPDQRFVAFAVFLPVGLALLVAAALLKPQHELQAALAGAVAVGYVVAAFFPCDVGSPVTGTPRQAVHNIAGAVQYVGGGFALLAMANSHGNGFKLAGAAVLVAAVMLTVLPTRSVRGLVQRLAEVVLFAALLYAMLLLLKNAG